MVKFMVFVIFLFSSSIWAKTPTIEPPGAGTIQRYTCFPKYGKREPTAFHNIYLDSFTRSEHKIFKRAQLRNLVFQNIVESHHWQETSSSFIKRWNSDESVEGGGVASDFQQRVNLKLNNETSTVFSTKLTERGYSSEPLLNIKRVQLTTRINGKSKMIFRGKAYDVFEIKETWGPISRTVGNGFTENFVQFYSPELRASLKTQLFRTKGLAEECVLQEIIKLQVIKVTEG